MSKVSSFKLRRKSAKKFLCMKTGLYIRAKMVHRGRSDQRPKYVSLSNDMLSISNTDKTLFALNYHAVVGSVMARALNFEVVKFEKVNR